MRLPAVTRRRLTRSAAVLRGGHFLHFPAPVPTAPAKSAYPLPFSCADGTAAASYRRPSARSRTTAQTSRRAPSPARSAPGVHVGHRISMPYSDSPNRLREGPLIRSANAVSRTKIEWVAPTPVRACRHRALPSVNRPPTRAARRWDSGRTGTRRRARRSTSPRPRRPLRRAGRCNRCARHFRA